MMNKCKEYEATVRDNIAMVNDNSQLQTAYQQGTASLDHNSLKKQKFTGRGRRNRSNFGSRECRPQNKPNETNARDVYLSVIQLQMDPVQPSSQHVDSAK